MGKTITNKEVIEYINHGETILDTDNIILIVLDKDVDVDSMQTIYKILHETKPKAKLLVMSENWLKYVKGGNTNDKLLVNLVEAYEAYLKAQMVRI